MSFMGNMAGKKAVAAHSKGDYRTALKLYEEAYAKGMDKAGLLRSYSVLLIRLSEFDKALEVLKKMEQMPMTDKERMDQHMNYAIILWQKGQLDRALEILDGEFRHKKNGQLYSVIGYLKIEKGDAEEALRFNQEAVEYDEEDGVFLDNLAQTYYRLLGDKETAKIWFDKAIARKPKAIDTNYFLALYDIENGDIESAKDRLDTARRGMFSPLNYATPEKIDQKRDELRGL